MRDFTQGNILRQVIVFTAPLILGNLLLSVYTIINMIWIGRLLGPEALAAVTSANSLLMLFPSLLIGLATATSIMVAQAVGRKDEKLIKTVLSTSFYVNMFLCLVLSVLGVVFSRFFLQLVNTPLEIMPLARVFFMIIIGGMIFQFFFNWMSGMLRGMGDAQTPLYFLGLAALLNLIMVPVLIQGWGLFPRLGLAGAAGATVLANFTAGLSAYFFISRKYPLFNIRHWTRSIDWRIFHKIFFIGIPTSLQMMIVSLSGIFIMSLINHFGVVLAAAAGMGLQMDGLAFMPVMAFGMAVTAMAGQNLGAGRLDRVGHITRYTILLSLAVSSGIGLFFFLFPRLVATLFLSRASTTVADQAALFHALTWYLRIGCFNYLGFALIFTFQGVIRGAGDTWAALFLTFLAVIVLRIPLAAFLAHKTPLQEIGIWIGILLSTVLAVIVNYLYYKSGRWQRIKLFKSTEPAPVSAAVATIPGVLPAEPLVEN